MSVSRHYEYRHVVGFEETDTAGTVFHQNLLRWQDRCREIFLLEHAPGVLEELHRGLELVPVMADCAQLPEIRAGDALSIRMRLEDLAGSEIAVAFDHVRISRAGELQPEVAGDRLVATGQCRIACLRDGERARIPAQLRVALARCASGGRSRLADPGTGGRA